MSVENDTLIEGQIYYEMTDFLDLIRYSKSEKKFNIRWEDSGYVHIDFNIPPNTQYQIFSKWSHTNITITAIGGLDSIFNQNRIYGGYLAILPNSYGYQVEFTDSIGISYDRSAGSYHDIRRNLIEAIVYDSSGNTVHFTNHYQPIFKITPLTIVNTPEFNLPFKVKHAYTRYINIWKPP